MALSLTCACGARLEIDEKFRGQTIPCPDCQKPLATTPAPREYKKTSVLALVSLFVTLIGAFTLVGPVLAVVCGAIALAQIARAKDRLAGRRLALAGMGLGVLFSLVSVGAYFWADWLGLDGLVRGLDWADRIDYTGSLQIKQEQTQGRGFSLERPNIEWGRFKGVDGTANRRGDSLVLINLREDAHILVMEGIADISLDECGFQALDLVKESAFLRRLGRLGPKDMFPKLEQSVYKQLPNTEILEMQLETKLAGIPRTILMRVQRMGGQLFVVAGLARKHRLSRLENVFHQVLETFKIEQ